MSKGLLLLAGETLLASPFYPNKDDLDREMDYMAEIEEDDDLEYLDERDEEDEDEEDSEDEDEDLDDEEEDENEDEKDDDDDEDEL